MTKIRVTGVQSRRPRVKPRALITLVLLVALVVVGWTQRQQIVAIVQAMSRGALLPLLMAVGLEGCRIVFHALSYTRAFAAIGARVPLRSTVPAWFKAVFMNTVVSSGGVSGMAAVVDAARTRGVAVGSATSAAVFTQTCYYSAMFLVILVGFAIMGANGSLSARDVMLGSTIGLAALVFLGLLALGHLKPGLLQRFMRWIESLVVRLCRMLRLRRQPKPWADSLVHSFSHAATELSRRPRKALGVLATMVVAMAFDMLAFMASGFAFGITRVDALLGGYVTALVFNSFTVTPGGVGVVEGMASAVLSGYGYPGTLCVSAVLTYRALMYWIPFAVGGVLMRTTGAFSGGQQQAKQAGPSRSMPLRERVYDFMSSRSDRRTALCALVVVVTSVFEIVCATLPADVSRLLLLSQYIPASGAIDPVVVVIVGYFLLLLVPGLLMHDQGCWLLAVVSTVALGVAAALSAHGLAGIVLVILALVALIVWQGCFTQHTFLRRLDRLVLVLVYAMALAALYAMVGMVALRGMLAPDPGFAGALWMGLQSLVTFPSGAGMGPHAIWFVGTVRAVLATLMAGMVFVLGMRLARRAIEYNSPQRREMRSFNRAEARNAQELRRADRAARRAERRALLRARLHRGAPLAGRPLDDGTCWHPAEADDGSDPAEGAPGHASRDEGPQDEVQSPKDEVKG